MRTVIRVCAAATAFGCVLGLAGASKPAAAITQFDSRDGYSYTGPIPCLQGTVPRATRPQDHTCVTPASRDAVALDNSLDASRKVPGSDTCLTGYVWRLATTDDHTCVTPEVYTGIRHEYYQTMHYYDELIGYDMRYGTAPDERVQIVGYALNFGTDAAAVEVYRLTDGTRRLLTTYPSIDVLTLYNPADPLVGGTFTLNTDYEACYIYSDRTDWLQFRIHDKVSDRWSPYYYAITAC